MVGIPCTGFLRALRPLLCLRGSLIEAGVFRALSILAGQVACHAQLPHQYLLLLGAHTEGPHSQPQVPALRGPLARKGAHL